MQMPCHDADDPPIPTGTPAPGSPMWGNVRGGLIEVLLFDCTHTWIYCKICIVSHGAVPIHRFEMFVPSCVSIDTSRPAYKGGSER